MTARVTKHLPLIASAPDGIQRLRTLILDLAIRGFLTANVSRGCSDQPIRSTLCKAAPFHLPSHWQWSVIGDKCELENGDRSSNYPNRSCLVPAGIPFINAGHLDAGRINLKKMSYIPQERFEMLRSGKVRQGDVLFCLRGSLGKTALIDDLEEGAIASSLVIVRPGATVVPRYLLVYFNTSLVANQISAYDNGTAQPNLAAGSLHKFVLPVPPIDEQHRIVAKVDELMALCDRLEADQADAEAAHAQLVQALLDSLTQATDAADFRASWQRLSEHFHTLFTTEASIDALKQTVLQLAVTGKLVPQDSAEESVNAFLQRLDDSRSKQDVDKAIRSRAHSSISNMMADPPYEAPNGWTWRSFGSLLNITGGVTLGRKLAGRKLISKPYVRVANVQRSYLVLDQIKQVEVPEDEVEKYKLLPNDLLITEGGDWDKVGRTAIWHGEIADCLHQNHVFRARSPSAEFCHRWAELYLNAQPARDYFAGSSKQTTNLASINMTQLRACAFPVPPLSEQHRIVAKVDELMALCDQLKAQLAKAHEQHAQLATALVEQAVA